MSDLSSAGSTGSPALRADLRRGTKAYDLIAAIPLISWYALSAIGKFGSVIADVKKLALARPDSTLILVILSKLAVLLFAIVFIGLLFARRPPSGGARGILPRIMAILGSYLSIGLLMLPQQENRPWVLALSSALILGGTAFAVYALVFLGRSISMLAEARRLVTSGPYSMIRHPLYLGEEIAFVGAALQFFSIWTPVLLAAQVCCQLYRMHYEETVLSDSFPDYSAYKARTFRIIPGVY